MFHLIYTSTATRPFSEEELTILLALSRSRNAAEDITGFLLYHNAGFVQILEGPEDRVRKTFARILRDPRHQNVVTVIEGPTAQREFAEWSMAFRHFVNPASLPEGYSDFLNTPFSGQEFAANPARSQKLLLSFKKLL